MDREQGVLSAEVSFLIVIVTMTNVGTGLAKSKSQIAAAIEGCCRFWL